MRIGLDFDNTIVSYDTLFHAVALEQGLIPASVAKHKNAVRDHLRQTGREPEWTAMQGYVYGKRMAQASAYPDAITTLSALKQAGHELFIISHKTQRPYAGPPYDLHAAAREWIHNQLIDKDSTPIVTESSVYFHETKDEKIARIQSLGCDIFLDDLPEILSHPLFPTSTRCFLFSPETHLQGKWQVVASWSDFYRQLGHG